MKRETQIICNESTAGECNNNASAPGTVSAIPEKRPRLQDSADLPARLASITLTRDDLKQLDALFADSEQHEQFSAAVSGCLVRIDRQTIGQKNDVIAQITGLVKPRQTQQLSLPNRRIFVINLGCFEFDQVAQQMPDRKDYEVWIADMELESLPLPSDEFLHEKALVLKELLSQPNTDDDEHVMKAEEGLMDGREEQSGGRDEGEAAATADEPTNRQGIMSSTASGRMLATSSSSAAMKDEGEVDSSDGGLDDGLETEVDQNCGDMHLNELVHTKELLNEVCVSNDLFQTVIRYPTLGHFLSGCFVNCRTRNTNEIIIDAIARVSPTEIKFKHSQQPILLQDLCIWDGEISSEVFAKWIEDMTRWDEPLPRIRVSKQYKKRALKALQKTKQFDPESELNRKQAREATKWRAREEFREMFGSKTRQIMVNTRQLVQLHQLVEAEFTRIVTGLFVRVRYTVANSETVSLEQIRTVSFDHPIYTMYGHRLTVRLHFERPAAAPVPMLDVQLDNIDQQLVEQHKKMVGNFVPPSFEFVLSKKEQLLCALSRTPKIVGKAKGRLLEK